MKQVLTCVLISAIFFLSSCAPRFWYAEVTPWIEQPSADQSYVLARPMYVSRAGIGQLIKGYETVMDMVPFFLKSYTNKTRMTPLMPPMLVGQKSLTYTRLGTPVPVGTRVQMRRLFLERTDMADVSEKKDDIYAAYAELGIPGESEPVWLFFSWGPTVQNLSPLSNPNTGGALHLRVNEALENAHRIKISR